MTATMSSLLVTSVISDYNVIIQLQTFQASHVYCSIVDVVNIHPQIQTPGHYGLYYPRVTIKEVSLINLLIMVTLCFAYTIDLSSQICTHPIV